MDLGLMVEGVVELDPMTGRMVVRVPQQDGTNQFVDVQAELERYKGKEVRVICTPMESVAALAEMLRSEPLV